MARKERSPESRIGLLEGEVERLTKAVRAVEGRLAVERERVRRLTGEVASREKGERLLRSALRLGPRSKAGAKGRLGDLEETVVSLQEYLLRTSERIDKILTALKEHREFLGELDKRVVLTGTRERIRLELDVMKNTSRSSPSRAWRWTTPSRGTSRRCGRRPSRRRRTLPSSGGRRTRSTGGSTRN